MLYKYGTWRKQDSFWQEKFFNELGVGVELCNKLHMTIDTVWYIAQLAVPQKQTKENQTIAKN